MMQITLFPFLTDETIEASVSGDVITINGHEVDLAEIPDGYRLPGNATGSEWLSSGSVERNQETLHLTLRLPVSFDSPDAFRNPVHPIVLSVAGGDINFPDTSAPGVYANLLASQESTDD